MTDLNPVIAALACAKVEEIVDPPRGWKTDMKVQFLRLPRDLQLYFAAHEKRRDKEISRCLSERADAVKKLAAAEDRLERAEARLKEIESAETETIAS